MKRNVKISIIVSVLVTFIISLFSLFAYFLNAGFDESRYFSRYSFDYYLLVHSKFVKSFPLPDQTTEVIYHSSCGDGPKPPSTAIHINTTNISQNYLDEIENFVKKNRLVKTTEESIINSSTVYEDQKGDEVEIALHQDKNGLYSITLEHRQYH